jgi:hypothetical protein
MNWRLIHTNTQVVSLFQTNDITITDKSIFNAPTQEECFNKIDNLKLIYYYPLNENEILLFSSGTRTIITNEN